MATRGAAPLADLVERYGGAVVAVHGRRMRRPGRMVLERELDVKKADAEALAAWYRRAVEGRPDAGDPPVPDAGEPASDAGELGEEDDPTEEVEPADHGLKVEIDEDEDGLHVSVKGQRLVMSYEDLVRVARIDEDVWRCMKCRVNTWTTAIKGDDGEPRIVRNWQVRADLERRVSERVQVVQPVAPLPRVQAPQRDRPSCTLMIPDSQHGFRWSADRRRLIPLHDRRACDLVVQVAERLQPDRIVLLGDMMDLAEWSTRYPRPAELRDTTQPTLAEVHAWLASIRQACPTARIDYVEGNHEQRIQRALVESSSPAADLTAVGDSEPVLSVPRLLALDALGIDYIGPYGADYYLHDAVRVTHGDKVRSGGGATAQAVIREATHSTWYGHVHRVELVHRTLHGPDGPRTIHAASPGCLCRIDGEVPGVTARPDWQQGVGVLWWDGQREHAEVRAIHDGRMVWDGAMLHGEERGQHYAEATGWAAVA